MTAGNLQDYSYPNGVTSSSAHNSLNRLTAMTLNTPLSALASYSYTLGPTGNRTAVTELGGRTINYTYDDLYRLTNEAIANDPHGVGEYFLKTVKPFYEREPKPTKSKSWLARLLDRN
jgi:YD repeat-containing protein